MRRDALDNREAVIAAARRMFSHGDTGASMRSIAREAGVGIATLSRHFPTKNDLVLAVIDDAIQDIEEVVAERLPDLQNEPEKYWSTTVFAIADLEIAALGQGVIGMFGLDSATEDEIALASEEDLAVVRSRRDRLERVYDELLRPAKGVGLVSADLEPLRFHLGLAAISRPLPEVTNSLLPGAGHWLIEVFLDGLELQAGPN